MSKTTNIRREFKYKGFDGKWKAHLTFDNKFVVTKRKETREYNLERITKIEHNLEYVHLYTEDGGFYQIKFEMGDFLVGDKFDKNSEHLDSFASHVFGEDLLGY